MYYITLCLGPMESDLQAVHIATGLNPADQPSRRWHRDAWTFREGCRRQLRALAPRPFSLDPFGTTRATSMAPCPEQTDADDVREGQDRVKHREYGQGTDVGGDEGAHMLGIICLPKRRHRVKTTNHYQKTKASLFYQGSAAVAEYQMEDWHMLRLLKL